MYSITIVQGDGYGRKNVLIELYGTPRVENGMLHSQSRDNGNFLI